jgi:hypothetical protein
MRNYNLGIAAVAYLRRVVENKINDVLDVLAETAQEHSFAAENPARDSAVNPKAAEPQETYATRWRRSRRFSPCSPSRLQRPSQWRHSWGYGTAKYRACCGKTIGTGNCTFPAQSGMAVSRTPRRARVARLFLSFDSLRIGWKCIGCAQGTRRLARSSHLSSAESL